MFKSSNRSSWKIHNPLVPSLPKYWMFCQNLNSVRDPQKNFLWASRLWVCRWKVPILSYVMKTTKKIRAQMGSGWFFPPMHRFFTSRYRMVGTRFFSITKRESFSFFLKNSSSKCFFSQMNTFFKNRVIILNRGSMPRKRTGRIATSQRDITRDCALIG